jgi:predicted dehydrogenase
MKTLNPGNISGRLTIFFGFISTYKNSKMSKHINVGVIGCELSEDLFRFYSVNKLEKFNFRKVFNEQSSSALASTFPGTEVVKDVRAIIHDADIELVIISNNHLKLVKEVVEAGKAVRVFN